MCRWLRPLAKHWIPAVAGMTVMLSANAYADSHPGIGRAATPAEVAAWDIDVRPDFKGLPPGSGSVKQGGKVWDDKCASCHGTFGESNEVFTPIVGSTTAEDIRTGRVKALLNPEIQRTTLMKLSTLSTLWDYVRRAMPWNAPKTLTIDEVYAVVAYMLNLGDILPDDFVLSDRNMAEVQARLPNRNGMTRDHGLWAAKAKPDVANVACMRDCVAEVRILSEIPEHARDSHGNLAEQQRSWAPTRAGAAPASGAVIAKRHACMSCHATDGRSVGPAFREVAQRYGGRPDASSKLLEKLRRGGSGAWGTLAMPPNPDLPDEDAHAVLAWILDGAK
jgi:cytochrome c551/c552